MSTSLQIKIGSKLFFVDDIIDKDLFAAKNVTIVTYPGGTVAYNVVSGARIGKIYSYIIRDGKFFWQFYENNYRAFIEHQPGYFSMKDLMAQGVLDTISAIEKEEEENKDVWDKIYDEIKPVITTLKVVLPVGIIAYVGFKVYNEYQKKSTKTIKSSTE